MSALFETGADDQVAISMPDRPYPGLRPFEESEWPIFFGRERMVDAVVSRLVNGHLVVVHGDSGSGKSSLVKAGVLPRLTQEQARGGTLWRTCTVLPRGGPLRNLARELAALHRRGADDEHVLALRRLLNRGRHAPAALAERLLVGEDDHLCILIDQFEELFEHERQPDGASEAQLLTDMLVSLAERPVRGLYVLVTMRSEYLGACARFAGLAEAVNEHQYLLPPMSASDLLRAIREPALLYGGEIDAALAEHLAADAAGRDGLPLVQHALMLLHSEHRGREGWRLTNEHYPARGLESLLSQHADAMASKIAMQAPQAQRLVEDMFRSLTAVTAEGHAIRRPRRLAELAGETGVDQEVVAAAVDVLRADGVSFLVPRGVRSLQPEDWIDIGHEALIRSWTAIADPADGWLMREFRNGLVWRSMLVQADSFERNPGNVLSEATTEERQRWMQRRYPAWADRHGGGWERVQALLDASVRARDEARAERERVRDNEISARLREQRLKWRVGAAALLVAGAATCSVTAMLLWQRAQKERQDTVLALKQYQVASEESTRLYEQTVKSQLLLATALRQLSTAQQDSNVALRSALGQAVDDVSTVASGLQQATTSLAPRVYVHIAVESQREAAEAFRQRLSQLRLEGMQTIVPGVQLVEKQANTGVLRCFREAECRVEAQQLLRLANSLLVSPKLRLQDLSSRYETAGNMRPRHYEVWFGHEEVHLVGK